jgi:hypothetical protein
MPKSSKPIDSEVRSPEVIQYHESRSKNCLVAGILKLGVFLSPPFVKAQKTCRIKRRLAPCNSKLKLLSSKPRTTLRMPPVLQIYTF